MTESEPVIRDHFSSGQHFENPGEKHFDNIDRRLIGLQYDKLRMVHQVRGSLIFRQRSIGMVSIWSPIYPVEDDRQET